MVHMHLQLSMDHVRVTPDGELTIQAVASKQPCGAAGAAGAPSAQQPGGPSARRPAASSAGGAGSAGSTGGGATAGMSSSRAGAAASCRAMPLPHSPKAAALLTPQAQGGSPRKPPGSPLALRTPAGHARSPARPAAAAAVISNTAQPGALSPGTTVDGTDALLQVLAGLTPAEVTKLQALSSSGSSSSSGGGRQPAAAVRDAAGSRGAREGAGLDGVVYDGRL
jgi:hypothetical protein